VRLLNGKNKNKCLFKNGMTSFLYYLQQLKEQELGMEYLKAGEQKIASFTFLQ
jgi:hypothetical protein